MLRFDIITIFADFFREAIDYGIVRRARAAGLVEIRAHDLRQDNAPSLPRGDSD